MILRISSLTFYLPCLLYPSSKHNNVRVSPGWLEDGRPRGSQQSLMSIHDELNQVYDVWPEKSAYNAIFPGEGSGASHGIFAFISFHHRVSSCILCAMNM